MDPADLLLAALGASGVLLLVLAWRSGTIALIATRPRQASTAIFLGIAVLTPAPALAGGGSGSITRRLTHQDHLGTRVLLVSDTPDVIYRRVFEPFGEVVAESVGTEGQIRYLTGKRESVATRDGVGGPGLVNFGARWYDPEIGRFLSIDPIVQAVGDPQTHNPYTYVRNDPVGLIDPNGLGFEKTFKRIVGGLAIAVGVILIAYQVPQAGYGMITYGVGLILETASDQRTQSWGLGLQALGLAMVAVGLALSSVTTPTTTPPTFPNQAGGGGGELVQSVASLASRSAAVGAAEAAEELAEVESSPEQTERARLFDIAVDIGLSKAAYKQQQFHGEEAGSFVLERELTWWDEWMTPGKFQKVGPFLVQRADLPSALGGTGAPFSEAVELPRHVAALALAPNPNLTNEQIVERARDFESLATFIGAPVFVRGRLGARFRADPGGGFKQER